MALGHPQPDPIEPGQESVWDYPRPPALVVSERPARVEVDGVVIANSDRAWRVLETSHPPAFYLPADDVAWDHFTLATANGTFCEWKGTASYWDVKVGETEIAGRAWSYRDPSPRFAGLADAVSFYPADFACFVGDERVRPQPGVFYGGWITDDIKGPFKGIPGSMWW